MKIVSTWLYVISAVAIAILGNSVSAIWAKGEDKLSIWLLALLLVSPMVFISFGLVTSRVGVAIGSSMIDSLLTLGTITVGLMLFQEWNKISMLQYLGMGLALSGILLMAVFPDAKS